MAQHAILRFEKHKGNPARPLEAHHERQKEQYASNPDIDTSRSKYNFYIVKPEGRYYHFIQSRIEQVGCRTRRDSTRFVDTLITASPEFFKKKSPKEIQEFFQRAADFLIGRVGKENIVSAVVHMDEKTPHLHLVFVPLTEDNRLCAKEIIGNRANLTKWQDDFHAYMVEKYPDLERGESASKTGRKHIPTRLFKQAVNLSKQARAIEATLDDITPFNAGIMPAVNPGISVSRVGGAAQLKAMKQVSGTLKLLYSQYRELQSFAQFGSDLDKDTKERLAQGERIVEVLKQDRNSPVPVELQVCIIFAVVNNYLRDVPVSLVKQYEKELYFEMNSYQRELLDVIASGASMTGETKQKLEAAIADFTDKFIKTHK